ncbi:hypothetical protein ACLQ2R_03360 [Streptosporangium sp. DT93]|uniref:hypothetical protein n=1 Tax=Streptosporangium sp. DT93 TaxID=3393428 RepID=UPI003CF0593F
MRPDPRLTIITEALRQPLPEVTQADMIYGYSATYFAPDAAQRPTPWGMQVDMLAHLIHTRLYGRPSSTEQASPLAQAEDAKRRRDLGGELDALAAGQASLQNAPWYPLQPGDVVHVSYAAINDVVSAFGETYLIEAGSCDGFLNMRLLARSGDFDPGADLTVADDPDPLFDVWFEAGPHTLTIVRHGHVVHPAGGEGR